MYKKIRNITITIFLIYLISEIVSKNYWECETNPKVVCQKTQTCCKKLENDFVKNELITSFECFEGINKICCGNSGVCNDFEICNPILNKCEKNKTFKGLVEIKESEEKIFVSFLEENVKKEIEKLEKIEKKKENEPIDKDYFENLDFEIKDLLELDIQKLYQNLPMLLNKLKFLEYSRRNITEFFDGFLSGLTIFESAYRNTTCEQNIKQTISDFNDFLDFLNTIKFDKDYFNSLHKAVNMLEEVYQDYRIQRKNCIDTYHKIAWILKKVFDRVLDPYFSRQVADHTICNYHELKNRTRSACLALRNHEYFQAGFKFGDVFRFFAFWDFNTTNTNTPINEFDEIYL